MYWVFIHTVTDDIEERLINEDVSDNDYKKTQQSRNNYSCNQDCRKQIKYTKY